MSTDETRFFWIRHIFQVLCLLALALLITGSCILAAGGADLETLARLNQMRGFDFPLPREYLSTAMLASLLCVWALTGVFCYLNRYTRPRYFSLWIAAWLYYALWLTLGISVPNAASDPLVQILRQGCISICAVFLVWGGFSFMERRVSPALMALAMALLVGWAAAGKYVVANPFYVQFPAFVVLGLAAVFCGLSFYHLRWQRQFVAVGLLCLGFFLWGACQVVHPLALRYNLLVNAGLLSSAMLQLWIGGSMLLLVLEEARHVSQKMCDQIQSATLTQRDLQAKVRSAEDKCRRLAGQGQQAESLRAACEQLRQAQPALVQQERLQATCQMTEGMAQAVHQALAPILDSTEAVLAQEPRLSESSRQELDNVRVSAEALAHVLARLREFCRPREALDQFSPFSLNDLVQQVLEATSPCWRDLPQARGIQIQVETRLAETLPPLNGDEDDLREALTHVVLNAVDALPNGGKIVVLTRPVTTPASPDSSGQITHLALEVSDDGVGMDETTRLRCLEPFFSTKQPSETCGLGLATVYGATQRHQGRIEILSQLDKGTTVRLLFPVDQAATAQAPAEAATVPVLPPLRLLCIDDEPQLGERLREELQLHHQQVETVENGQAGLDAFRKAKDTGQPFDAVLADLGTPEVDGCQIAEAIKAVSPDTPVILLAGSENAEPPPQVAKVDAWLSKPLRVGELLETVQKLRGRAVPAGA